MLAAGTMITVRKRQMEEALGLTAELRAVMPTNEEEEADLAAVPPEVQHRQRKNTVVTHRNSVASIVTKSKAHGDASNPWRHNKVLRQLEKTVEDDTTLVFIDSLRDKLYFAFQGIPTQVVLSEPWPTIATAIILVNLVAVSLSCTVLCLSTVIDIIRVDALRWTLFAVETLTIAWFIVDYVVRISTSRIRLQFAIRPANILDLLTIVPYFVELSSGQDISALAAFRVIRLTRVMRLARLSRTSGGLRDVMTAMRNSGPALSLLLFLLAIALTVFATGMYYAEQFGGATFDERDRLWIRRDGHISPFQSIYHAMWWCIVTMTTVGYGDDVPVTPAGKFVGFLTMFAGVLVIAFPTVILSATFHEAYSTRVTYITLQKIAQMNGRLIRLKKKGEGQPEDAAEQEKLLGDVKWKRRHMLFKPSHAGATQAVGSDRKVIFFDHHQAYCQQFDASPSAVSRVPLECEFANPQEFDRVLKRIQAAQFQRRISHQMSTSTPFPPPHRTQTVRGLSSPNSPNASASFHLKASAAGSPSGAELVLLQTPTNASHPSRSETNADLTIASPAAPGIHSGASPPASPLATTSSFHSPRANRWANAARLKPGSGQGSPEPADATPAAVPLLSVDPGGTTPPSLAALPDNDGAEVEDKQLKAAREREEALRRRVATSMLTNHGAQTEDTIVNGVLFYAPVLQLQCVPLTNVVKARVAKTFPAGYTLTVNLILDSEVIRSVYEAQYVPLRFRTRSGAGEIDGKRVTIRRSGVRDRYQRARRGSRMGASGKGGHASPPRGGPATDEMDDNVRLLGMARRMQKAAKKIGRVHAVAVKRVKSLSVKLSHRVPLPDGALVSQCYMAVDRFDDPATSSLPLTIVAPTAAAFRALVSNFELLTFNFLVEYNSHEDSSLDLRGLHLKSVVRKAGGASMIGRPDADANADGDDRRESTGGAFRTPETDLAFGSKKQSEVWLGVGDPGNGGGNSQADVTPETHTEPAPGSSFRATGAFD